MGTNSKNKNASHLTHEMKNKHGDLAKASEKAEMQPILEALCYVAKEESEGYKKAAEGYKQVLEAKEKADKILNTLKAISHDNNIIDIEPEDEKD
ncbi:hypothetical protein BB472_01225 [Helicobacter pylori]|uniref:Uncharacterized protein n=2 Tax=Helicobacter pylori TaxID=210 RepID=A0A2A6S453_HELPX|nr:hypothetical protein [Helicobacter pylori]MBM0596510.1 hypothetical protein [Helicobacter pylori]MBM0599741.1 hypothetical protein [Helicobacter pylori]MBM0607525.1 hypothetical protein [Helicobacter pylori]OOP82571.1 hypothetical protein B0X30_01930 [Helicobacter pylori]OOP88417.1 hypothetical protein B0X39_07065 [Helicobacter pylori]